MKGHMFHVRRKMKENNGKLKKIEDSSLKRLMRMRWYLLSFHFRNSLFILSLSHSWILRVFMDHFNIGSKKEKKAKRKKRSIKEERDQVTI